MKHIKKAALTLLLATAVGVVNAQNHLGSVNPGNFDPEVPASVDFYKHVNAGWMKNNPLPAERSRFGQFDVLSDTSKARIKNIVLGLAATNPKPGTVAYQVANLYQLAIDSTRRNAQGNQPIQKDIKKIEGTAKEHLPELIMWMHANYGNPFSLSFLR